MVEEHLSTTTCSLVFPLYQVLPLKVLQSKASELTGADFEVLNFARGARWAKFKYFKRCTGQSWRLRLPSLHQRMRKVSTRGSHNIRSVKKDTKGSSILRTLFASKIKNSPSKFISYHYDIHTLVYHIQTYLYVGFGVYFILNLIEGYTYFVLSRLGLA